MSNVIPYQLLCDGTTVKDLDHSYKKRENLEKIIKDALGDSAECFKFYKQQKIATGVFHDGSRKVYFMVANITFMGGKEGQHPLDLKRIQYNFHWKDFYDSYITKGEVKWLGLYSYKNINIFADFKPESYLKKHNNDLVTKNGRVAEYSCHIFLNDLYQGLIDGFFNKIDKNGNSISTISLKNLKSYFKGTVKENPIITKIRNINESEIPWNRWVKADEAIPFMYSLYKKYNDRPNFVQFRQNLWNGWYVEALYSENLVKTPSNELSYLATEKSEEIRKRYKTGLDLAFPSQNFVGDLKAIGINGGGQSLLNDETRINAALSKYKRIWFVIYLHDSMQGKTNDYEMVKWRNHFIASKDDKEVTNELDAPLTPHSVCYKEMIVIELNEITKAKYFDIGAQFGLNSDGHERAPKYKISKKTLKGLTNEDSIVIYREKH